MNINETYDKKITRYLYPLLIIVCGIGFFSRLPVYMDILFSDEGNYLLTARNMFGTMDYTFGPLYSLWLKGWSFIFSDPVQLYYFNYAALSILIPLLLYFLLRQLSFNASASFFTALSFLYSAINVSLWPRVSHFSLILILSGLLLALQSRQRIVQLQIIALCALVTSYARPEYFMLSILFTVLAFYYILKDRNHFKKTQTGLFLLVFIIILLLFKFPVNQYALPGNYTRSYIAFIQHYYLGLEFEGKKFDYWWLSAKDFYWFGEFKKCDGSVFKFALYYTPQFIHHVLFDVKMYGLQILSKLLLISNPVFTKLSPRDLFISGGFIIGAIGIFISNVSTRLHSIGLVKKNKFNICILFLLVLPSFTASLVILPRDHYIFLQVPFFILFTGIYAETLFTRIPQLKFMLLPVVLLCLFFQHPGRYSFIKADPKRKNNTNVQLIKYLRDSLPDRQSYHLFTDNLYVTGLLPKRFTEATLVEYSFDFKNFSQFISDKKINLIMITPETHREPYLRRDSIWNNFLKDPGSIGFHRVYAGEIDSTYQLYIK